MTNEELKAHNRDRRIYQIAWVTNDLEKSMDAWIENLKVGPWRVYTFTDATVRDLHVDGKPVTGPFEFRIAISWIGDMEVELIQPVHGPTIYQAFIDRKGAGLHHIKEKVGTDELDTVVKDYADRGIGVMQTGRFFEDVHAYLDTEPRVDFIYEFGNCPVQDLPPDVFSIYPPEGRS